MQTKTGSSLLLHWLLRLKCHSNTRDTGSRSVSGGGEAGRGGCPLCWAEVVRGQGQNRDTDDQVTSQVLIWSKVNVNPSFVIWVRTGAEEVHLKRQ